MREEGIGNGASQNSAPKTRKRKYEKGGSAHVEIEKQKLKKHGAMREYNEAVCSLPPAGKRVILFERIPHSKIEDEYVLYREISVQDRPIIEYTGLEGPSGCGLFDQRTKAMFKTFYSNGCTKCASVPASDILNGRLLWAPCEEDMTNECWNKFIMHWIDKARKFVSGEKWNPTA